jgi:hypothetical protein
VIGTGSEWTTLVWEGDGFDIKEGRKLPVLTAEDPLDGEEGPYEVIECRGGGWQAFMGGRGSPITKPTSLGAALAACEADLVRRVHDALKSRKGKGRK